MDLLVLTAAHDAQARAAEARLRAREAQGRLPASTHGDGSCRWMVVTDPRGRRVGSGASTLLVLRAAAAMLAREHRAASFAELFARARILVVHSGGDARRLPAYAAAGKAFVPVPRRDAHGMPAEVFDLVLEDLLALPWPEEGRVIVAAGDLVVGVAGQPLDLSRPGVTGIASPEPLVRASQHGVYVLEADGTVLDFLQKPDTAAMRAAGAVLPDGRALVDSGIVALAPDAADAWLRAAGARLERRRVVVDAGLLRDAEAGRLPSVDLYQQILMAHAPRAADGDYAARCIPPGTAPAAAARLAALPDAMRGLAFAAERLASSSFLHFGTTRELLRLLTDPAECARHGLAARCNALAPRTAAAAASARALVIHGSLLDRARIVARGRAVVEGCAGTVALRLDGDNVVVGLPPGLRGALHLPRGACVLALPSARRRWAIVPHGLDDDFKSTAAQGGTLLGRPLDAWRARLETHGCAAAIGGDLWTSPLWATAATPAAAWKLHAWMLDAHAAPPPAWRRAERRTLPELLARVDQDRLVAGRDDIRRAVDRATARDRLAAEPWLPAATLADAARTPAEARRMHAEMRRAAAAARDRIVAARLEMVADAIAERRRGLARRRGEALACVTEAVAEEIRVPTRAPRAAVRPDQAIWTSSPVRIDLAGGWSDTPPTCNEVGGTVLNAAIRLNGTDPVQVVAKVIDEPVIALHSTDLAAHETVRTAAQLRDHGDPGRWSSLLKAALVLAGFAPHGRSTLRRRLERFGGGLALSTFSAVPKGSGLGTSSILGAAVLACLDRVLGAPFDPDDLVARTSLLEQLLGTRGGWQDQVGGLHGGLKIARTAPGARQQPAVEPIALPDAAAAELRARAILYYTGHRRMAKDILESVVGRWLARVPAAVRTVPRLKAGAEAMADALRAGDVDDFAAHLADYWRLKCTLDPASTNAAIESMLDPVRRDLAGWVLPGAGGGGFILMLAHDVAAAQRVRRRLEAQPPNRLARLFDVEFAPEGVKVAVL